MILEFDADDRDSCDVYAERMQRRTQERQRRAEEQAMLRALFEEQRRAQAKRVAELHKQRVEEAKTQREAEKEQARQHLAARAAEQEKLRQFFQALTNAMNAQSELEGAELERKNAIRRNTVPIPVETPAPAPVPAPASAPVSPKVPVRSSSPAPSTSSDASDASLHSIAHLQDKYDSLRTGFTFPSNLSFASSSSSPAASPSLLYNPTNAPVHAYEHALTGLLTELDAVESFGDEHVRDVRRTLARAVEAELEALEQKKREAWRKQQDAALAPAVESTPAPAPALVESTPAAPVVEPEPTPVVESESTPATVPAAVNPAASLVWLTSRLAQESQPQEDAEVKAVREGLLARLAPLAPAYEPMPAPVTEFVPAAEPAETVPVEKVVESMPAEEPVESAVESSEPVLATEELAVTPEPASEPAPVQPSATSESESEPTAVESEATEAHTPIEPAPAPESEPVPTTTEALPVPEPELAPTPASELESISNASEPEIVIAAPEPVTFVQVFPESELDSDAETDADLVSELADRKSANGGDEFEML
ncbi:hypothetical protein FS749_011883 [Ceratobasidium sp. UAMH 11750]|nr:hypothetical protein FS749_011883 [Ceratobasidium sp. UAMH 11750]